MRDTRRRRERDESRERRRNRSRSRDRERNRSRSRSRDRTRSGERAAGSSKSNRPKHTVPIAEPPILTEKDFEGKSNEEIEMMKIMGISGFDTTKNKKVKSNNAGDVHVSLKRKYRQYMNRKGGFNRPLDAIL